jgi:hypothetical protein
MEVSIMTIVKKLLIVASMALGLQAINLSANGCSASGCQLITQSSQYKNNPNNNKTLRACPCSKNTRNQQRRVVKRVRIQTNACPCMKRSR